jgi:hypothetical protein
LSDDKFFYQNNFCDQHKEGIPFMLVNTEFQCGNGKIKLNQPEGILAVSTSTSTTGSLFERKRRAPPIFLGTPSSIKYKL